MYKLFYFDTYPAVMRYVPIKGVWPSIHAFLVFLRLRFGDRRFFYSGISKANFIKIPFNGSHLAEATGYSLSDIKYRKPRVASQEREAHGKKV